MGLNFPNSVCTVGEGLVKLPSRHSHLAPPPPDLAGCMGDPIVNNYKSQRCDMSSLFLCSLLARIIAEQPAFSVYNGQNMQLPDRTCIMNMRIVPNPRRLKLHAKAPTCLAFPRFLFCGMNITGERMYNRKSLPLEIFELTHFLSCV